MPTREYWIEPSVLGTSWTQPLSAAELATCFQTLTAMIDSKKHDVAVLFDIREAKTIPAQAPVLAIRSRFLTRANTGKIAVVSTDVIAQILAEVASSVTRREILFFPLYETALDYLKKEAEKPAAQGG